MLTEKRQIIAKTQEQYFPFIFEKPFLSTKLEIKRKIKMQIRICKPVNKLESFEVHSIQKKKWFAKLKMHTHEQNMSWEFKKITVHFNAKLVFDCIQFHAKLVFDCKPWHQFQSLWNALVASVYIYICKVLCIHIWRCVWD